jgi:hypothetical protein
MKPESVECLKRMGGLVLAGVLMLIFYFMVSPAYGQDRPLVVPTTECAPPNCVMVQLPAFQESIRRGNEYYERAIAAEKRVQELEAQAPKCAKSTVVEPPKPLPPIKKERDS